MSSNTAANVSRGAGNVEHVLSINDDHKFADERQPLAATRSQAAVSHDAQTAAVHYQHEQSVLRTDEHSTGREGCMSLVARYMMIFFSYLLSIIPLFWLTNTKIADQYDRFVRFRLGKLVRPALGPGLFYFLPCVDTWRRVDLRTVTYQVPTQEMMTRDSVTVNVNAVVYYHIRDAIKSVVMVQDVKHSTALLASTTLRAVIGESELDELLQKREAINNKLRAILETTADAWGVSIELVEVRDVQLPAIMQRAMAAQAEAERERRAKVISSEGELQASTNLLRAANQMSRNRNTMQLRYLQTLTQISQEKNSTIVFPLPVDMVSLLDRARDFVAPNVNNNNDDSADAVV